MRCRIEIGGVLHTQQISRIKILKESEVKKSDNMETDRYNICAKKKSGFKRNCNYTRGNVEGSSSRSTKVVSSKSNSDTGGAFKLQYNVSGKMKE